MKQHRKSTYTARMNIFLAGCKEEPEIIKRLKDASTLYESTSVEDRMTWPMICSLCDCTKEDRELFLKVEGFDPWALKPLKDALESWACFIHNERTIKLLALGDWVYDIALFQLSDWRRYPKQTELCYTWRNFKAHPSIALKDKRPPKFIYTLAVRLEDYWEGALNNKPDWVTFGGVRSLNPYAVVNSESGYDPTDKNLTDGERAVHEVRESVGLKSGFQIEDWNPESGETKAAFKKRVFEDFKVRLEKHLLKVEQYHYEPSDEEQEEKRQALDATAYDKWYSTEAKQPPRGKKHSDIGDRDYLWTFQRYALDMKHKDIAEAWNKRKSGPEGQDTTLVIEGNVIDQVVEVRNLAMLPGSEKIQ